MCSECSNQHKTVHDKSKGRKAFTQRRMMIFAGIFAAHIIGFAAFGLLIPKGEQGFAPQIVGAPSLAVIGSDLIDHGDVAVSTFVESTFQVQNVGDKPLFIIGDPFIEVVEGCCPPRASADAKSLEPGEITTIRTRFTMGPGMGGPHDFRLHVRTNDPAQPNRVLRILSNWTS
jgi:hypothetical protein